MEIPTLTEFREALTPAVVRSIQIIQGAMGLGVLTFGMMVVVVAVAFSAEAEGGPSDVGFMTILSLVHAGVAITVWLLLPVVFKKHLSPKMLDARVLDPKRGVIDDPAEKIMVKIRLAIIVRLAALKGAALLGLVVCMMLAFNGVGETEPIYWSNSVSAFVFLAFNLATFPSRDRLERIFREKVACGSS